MDITCQNTNGKDRKMESRDREIEREIGEKAVDSGGNDMRRERGN